MSSLRKLQTHRVLPGTVYTAAEEIEAAGGRALPLVVDIRDDNRVHEAVQEAADHFGGIDIRVNNASAIQLTGTLQTKMKRYDLMHQVNTRGTFVTSQACLPYLLKGKSSRSQSFATLNMEERWFAPFTAYTMAKF